jgi:selenide,water dikinase
MGGTPLMAIAVLGWPLEKLPAEVAQRVLEGGRSICAEAGIPLAGGHTIDSSDPIFGLAVTGTVSLPQLKQNNKAQDGDILFLTKPIGVGIIATAVKRKLLKDEHYPALVKQLSTLNKTGADLGKLESVHAMTDVTGFGLLGHLVEMTEGSGLSVELDYNSLRKVEGVDEYIKLKSIPDATSRNWNSYSTKVQFEKGVDVMEAFNLLPDPQTNGGLLIAVKEDAADQVRSLLVSAGLSDFTQSIGRFTTKKEKVVYVK